MTWVVLLAAAVLAAVAAGGVLRPFGKSRTPALEKLADPLEDERAGLVRALRDLEEERATGGLEEDAYRSLRLETETRTVAVLRALEARDGAGELAAGLKSLREPSSRGNGAAKAPRPRFRLLATAGVAAASVSVAAVLLAGALRNRGPDQPITGGIEGNSSQSALAFFEQRVADHPRDVAARLDLAEQYLEAGNGQDAIAQYLAALSIEPRNPEAHAELGFLIFRSGKAEDGLRAVQQALDVQPNYPQALYYKAFILLRGLHRPADAAAAFRAYLQAAPYGARRSEVESLLKEAEPSQP
jgi:cytochrome c-type biogenesis protein CcmH/NrfG